ncbi:MAG: PAS domain S-box protein, partial [Gammaproteobacteria bacterium]
MSLEQEDTTLELARLRSALDRTLTAMMMIDRDLVITYANKATLELMRAREETLRATYPGFSVDTLIGSCIDMFHADASHQRKLLADPANLPFSTDIKVADLVFNIQVTAQRDTDGAYIGNTLEWHDVTEQRRVESEMKDFTAKFAAISRAQAYIEFDVDGTIIDANENFLGALGYARDEVVGRHHRMFVEPEHASSPEYRALWERLQRGEYASGEFKRIAKGGNEVWIQASYCPVLDDSGKPYKVVKYASDITARKTAFNRCESIMAAIAEGDLTRLMEGEYSGDLAALQAAVNDTVTRLRDMVEKIRTSALSINSAASEVAKGNTELSARTEEQASSLEETAASMEEMTSTVQQNADNSRQANQLASSARDQASEGGEVVGRAVSAMAEINESSKKIADIIGVI